IGIAMLAIYLAYKKEKESFALCHQERMLALEKGLDVPPWPAGLVDEADAPYDTRRHLLKGLVWLFIGIALGLGLWSVVDKEGAHYSLFSLVFIGIGAAHLIYYFVEGKKQAAVAEQQQTAPVARS
ncbi:MAG TPA: DUF6249 domain-containing protein, partial [Verrucomicrobiae bacterium]